MDHEMMMAGLDVCTSDMLLLYSLRCLSWLWIIVECLWEAGWTVIGLGQVQGSHGLGRAEVRVGSVS